MLDHIKSRAEAEEQAIALMRLTRKDPLRFVLSAFPWGIPGTPLAKAQGPEPWQAELLANLRDDLALGRSPVRIAVASGHGVGKSALVAWLVLWALATQPGTRGVVTANTETQLRTKTWAELAKWHGLSICRDWLSYSATAIAAAEDGKAAGWRVDLVPWSAHNAEAFAGLHNQGGRLLLVFDEASAIADTIWETAEGALTDAHTEIVWLAFGNPTRNGGRFHDCFGRFKARWRASHVDARAVSFTNKAQIAEWVRDYGEDSDFVKVRVRGDFPKAGALQFIDGQRVREAMTRELLPAPYDPVVMGVDVARFGDDRSVIFIRKGRDGRTWPIEKLKGLDLMQLAGRVCARAAEVRARAVFVDEGGIGAGVVDRLRQLGVPGVHGINFASRPSGWTPEGQAPLYANKRAEMWGMAKGWLEQGALPDEPELAQDLTGVEYGYDARNAIQLERKEDMKKRGLLSPDIGDALALTFAWPLRPELDHTWNGGSRGSFHGGTRLEDDDPIARWNKELEEMDKDNPFDDGDWR
jgi:hypothetical protein